MASSGEAFGAFSGRNRFLLRAAVAVKEVDEANNRARWDWSLQVVNVDNSSLTWDAVIADSSMAVNGTFVHDTKTPGGTFDFRDGAPNHQFALSTTGWIQYNSDGNKTIPFVGAVANAGIFGGASASGAVAADRINHPAHSGLTATRNSDSQITLSWTRHGNYSGAVIHRRTNGGAWQQVGAPSGNVTSFVDKTTTGNRKYEYRVIGKAGNAQSVAWSNVATVYTTPAVPTGVSAVRQGGNIVVSASGRPPYATLYDVRDGATVVGSLVSLPWTHVAPNPAVPHTYTVRARIGSLASAYSSPSNTVQLLTPPNAPTGLAPNGSVTPSDEDVMLRWVHNPADASPQAEFEIRHRETGGSWTTVAGGAESELPVPLPVSDYEWQVRTKGAHPDFGAWSAVAVFTVIDRPGVAILQPDTEWDASILPVEWSWFQPQSRPQSGWQAELVNGSETVEARNGSGSAAGVTFDHRLTEGTWTVRVRAATGDVWSEWAIETFTVTFDPPAPPVLEGTWDDIQGGVLLTVGVGTPGGAVLASDGAWYAAFGDVEVSNIGFDNGHPYIEDGADTGALFDGPTVVVTDADLPDTAMVTVERSIDGAVWEPVADTNAVASLIDWESWSYGDIQYRATAFSAEGATTVATITVEARSGSLWLSGGVGFGVTARLPHNPDVQVTAGRSRALKQYAGRSLPVAYTGEAKSRVVSVSGTVMQASDETAAVDELVQVAQIEQDTFLFRDPDGRRIYGVIGEISLPREVAVFDEHGINAYWGYSFALTETEQR